MALLTVAGVYDKGRVELEEEPAGVESARVIVTFLPAEPLQSTVPSPENLARGELRQRFKERLRRGIDFGDEPIPTREQIYEQRHRRFE